MKTLVTAIASFIDHCMFEKNLSTKTIKAYKIDLKQILKFIKERNFSDNISEISKAEIKGYLESITQLKPKSIKRKGATFKSLFNFLEFEDSIEINPFRKMKIKIKEQKVLPKALNRNQINSIFKTAHNSKNENIEDKEYSDYENSRNVVIIELLYSTGARVSEIANIKDSMIDVKTGELKILGKGNKERIIHICNPETLFILEDYRLRNLERIKLSGDYFLVNRLNKKLSEQSIRSVIKKISQKSNVQVHVTPHMFRHSVATHLLENEVDIKYIQSILGHSSISTTQIYTHINREKQKHILKSKHPRKDICI